MRRIYDPLLLLVQTLDDGIEFYRIAEKKSESPLLKSVFVRLAEIRELALAYLVPYLDLHDFEVEKSFTYHDTLANRYAPLLQGVVQDKTLNLVREVEEHLVDAMISAATASHNALAQCIIKDLIPVISRNFENCLQDCTNTAGAVAA